MRLLRLPPIAAALLVAVLSAGLLAVVVGRQPQLEAIVVQDGLTIPWAIAFAPDGRMLVTERAGTIRIYASGQPDAPLLATVEVPDVRAEGEAGLMGILVDPLHPAEPWVYVCASRDPEREPDDASWRNELLRYRLGDGGDLELDGVLFAGPMRAAFFHNGCTLRMDGGRNLWLTMGDSNLSAANVNPAQDPASLNGKILRLETDGTVPADNPVLPGADGPSPVYSLGHRNPQGLALRASDGMIVSAEHGTDRDDELNVIVPGGNYGYACWSGTDAPGPAMAGPAGDACGDASAYIPSAWTSGFPTIATSAATFLEGSLWGDWEGSLIVTTLKDADLRRFTVAADGTIEPAGVLLDQEFGRLRAAVIGPDGALYLSTSNHGDEDVILRVAPGS